MDDSGLPICKYICCNPWHINELCIGKYAGTMQAGRETGRHYAGRQDKAGRETGTKLQGRETGRQALCRHAVCRGTMQAGTKLQGTMQAGRDIDRQV